MVNTSNTTAVIDRFGEDDFSAYFPDLDYSVRGTLREVLDETTKILSEIDIDCTK